MPNKQVTEKSSAMKPFLKIAPFEGDPLTLEWFFDQVSELKQLNGWREKEAIAFLKTKLSGPALRFFIEESSLKLANSINEIKGIFANFFRQDTKMLSLTKWNSLKMIDGESIRNFAHRLSVLFTKAHPEILDSTSENVIKFNHFLALIPLDNKIKILENNISNFEEAVVKAQTLQELQEQHFGANALPSTSQKDNFYLEQINSLREEVSALKTQNTNVKHAQKNVKAQNSNYHNQRPRHNPYQNYRGRGNQNKSHGQKFQNRRPNQFNRPNFQPRQTNKWCKFCEMQNHNFEDCFKFKNLVKQQVREQTAHLSNNQSNLNASASTFRPQANLN